MAEQLKLFEFTGRGGGNKGESKYDQYLDGNIYRLVFGEDIPGPSAEATLRKVAKNHGLKLRVHGLSDGFVIQAYTSNGNSS